MSTPTSEPIDVVALADAGFDALYAERIEPMFAAREAERESGVRTFQRRAVIGGLIALAIAAGILLAFRHVGAAAFFGLFAAALAFTYAMMPLEALRKDVKRSAIGAIADAIGVRFQADNVATPGFDRCQALRLVPSFDRSSFEDLFHGERHGCAFDLYEAKLEEERRGKNGSTTYVTIFRGQIIQVSFPKPFHGVTVVLRDAGLFNNWRGGDLKRVGLTDPHFERTFEVYSNDQVEARALVHPALMERLLGIEAAFKGGKVRCAFEGGVLLVVVEGGDQFEIGSMFKPLADPLRARKIVDEIAQVMRLIDTVLSAEQAALMAYRAGKEPSGA